MSIDSAFLLSRRKVSCLILLRFPTLHFILLCSICYLNSNYEITNSNFNFDWYLESFKCDYIILFTITKPTSIFKRSTFRKCHLWIFSVHKVAFLEQFFQEDCKENKSYYKVTSQNERHRTTYAKIGKINNQTSSIWYIW